MFAKVKDILAGLTQHSEKNQMAAVEAELSRGWSFAAFDKLQQLAENNNVSAQYRLGQMFERAKGVVQNLPDAVQWYRRAAERGHAFSQARLGLIHFLDPLSPAALTPDEFERFGGEPRSGTVLKESFPNGFVVEKDHVQAAHWNRLAAEAGVAEAQARYGLQLANGLGLDRNVTEAERWFLAAAAQGETAGQLWLGILYAGGYGSPSDFPRAIEWLTKAAAGGSSVAQYWITGSLLLRGEGVDRDAVEGAKHLLAAADQGHLDANYLLAIALWQGEWVPADFSRAEALLRRAALRGHIEAAFALGEFLLERQDDEGFEGAKWLKEAADAGHKRAAAVLGELCLSGRGLPRDPSAAARWLEIGEEESRPDAFISLAFLYSEGIGVERDYEAAATWFAPLAAERGSTTAQFNLGSFYRFALGVPRDDEEAVQRYRIAAEKGSAEAAFQLGLLYAEPDSELHDYEKAAAWFSRASQAGHDLARCNLAFLLIEGKGIEGDPERGLELLEAAVANGSVAAAEALVGLHSSGRHFPLIRRRRLFASSPKHSSWAVRRRLSRLPIFTRKGSRRQLTSTTTLLNWKKPHPREILEAKWHWVVCWLQESTELPICPQRNSGSLRPPKREILSLRPGWAIAAVSGWWVRPTGSRLRRGIAKPRLKTMSVRFSCSSMHFQPPSLLPRKR